MVKLYAIRLKILLFQELGNFHLQYFDALFSGLAFDFLIKIVLVDLIDTRSLE